MRTRLAAAFGLILIAGALWAGVGGARANGVPQLVKLTYLDGVSNFGPNDGEGVVEFSFAEAYLRLEVKNLVPQPGHIYEGWLLGGAGEPLPVGPITVAPSGLGTMETKIEGLERYDYNLFVVAARAPGDAAKTMPAQKSIAGRFTLITDGDGETVGGDARPAQLPDTGEPSAGPPWSRIFMTGGVMAGAAFILAGLVRTARRRRTS